MRRKVLDLTLEPEEPAEDPRARSSYEVRIAQHFGIADQGRPGDRWLLDTVRWAWRTRILVRLDIDLRSRLWQEAEDEAVRVFAANLRDLLLAAPAGTRPTIGLDPGLRTGVKVAVAARQSGRHRDDLPARTAEALGRSTPSWRRSPSTGGTGRDR